MLEGTGKVAGAENIPEAISAGQAVFWAQGEEHETTSTEGMTALVLEGSGLQMYLRPT